MSGALSHPQALAKLTAPGEPYELEIVEIRGKPRRVFRHAPATLRALYADAVSDKTFYVFEDERLTFAQAYRQAAKFADILVHRFKVAKGDRVAIAMRNYPEWVLAFMAATSVGAIAVAMNAHWQGEEMAFGLEDCGAKVLVADRERLERLKTFAADAALHVVAVRADDVEGPWRHWSELMDRIDAAEMPAVALAPDDPATIFYTSGSTGNPKGVVSTHRNVISALLSWEVDAQATALATGAAAAPPERQPATLMGVPLFHVMGSHVNYLQSYRAQRKIVAMYKWDVERAAELIEREQITNVSAPPAMTGDLVRLARTTTRDLSSLLSIGGGGASRAPEQVEAIAASFANAKPGTGWGMTETNAIGTTISGQDYLARPTSSGRCLAVLDFKIVDDSGVERKPGEPGELLVRGTSVFTGYWNRSDVDREVFVDGDWFRTGDVAIIDAEGYLYIVDRIKDLIIRGGENVGCGQVEAALLLHPKVHEAAVYAVPDARLGEEVGATVYADEGLEAEALRDFAGRHLARFEVPRYVTILHRPLPRTASGKILKRQLKDEAVKALTPA